MYNHAVVTSLTGPCLEFLKFTLDFAEIQISYVPDLYCAELKSLKEYMHSYRDVGIFHEHVVNKILEDFVAGCQPRRVQIVGDFNIRGGIKTVVQAEYVRSTDANEN